MPKPADASLPRHDKGDSGPPLAGGGSIGGGGRHRNVRHHQQPRRRAWTHIALTCDGTTMRLCVRRHPVGPPPQPPAPCPNRHQPTLFGGSSPTASIARAPSTKPRVYSRALTARRDRRRRGQRAEALTGLGFPRTVGTSPYEEEGRLGEYRKFDRDLPLPECGAAGAGADKPIA